MGNIRYSAKAHVPFPRLQPRSTDQLLDDLVSSVLHPLLPPKKRKKKKITVEQITTNYHILSFINLSVGSSKR